MSGTRYIRIAVELLAIALLVAAVVSGSMYGIASLDFDHPATGDSARRSFIVASIVLSGLCTVAAWVLWLAWRRRAALDAQPDAPARLLALAVATLPESRRDWGTAMTAELSNLAASRWSFAAGSARAALLAPAGDRRPATGWAGAAEGVLGVLACAAAAGYMLAAYPKETADATSPFFGVVLVIVLAACLALSLVAPPALTSSSLARRAGIWLGAAAGAGLLLLSRAGVLDAGALTFILPAQLLTLVVVPAVVATVTRSLGAAVQTILWGFVFGTVVMFPVYIAESVRRYHADGGLYLDGDADVWTTIGTNFQDAVAWLLILAPSLLVPLGIVCAALATAVARPS
jgi:hypothetical protein